MVRKLADDHVVLEGGFTVAHMRDDFVGNAIAPAAAQLDELMAQKNAAEREESRKQVTENIEQGKAKARRKFWKILLTPLLALRSAFEKIPSYESHVIDMGKRFEMDPQLILQIVKSHPFHHHVRLLCKEAWRLLRKRNPDVERIRSLLRLAMKMARAREALHPEEIDIAKLVLRKRRRIQSLLANHDALVLQIEGREKSASETTSV